jgi:hypothetical protein
MDKNKIIMMFVILMVIIIVTIAAKLIFSDKEKLEQIVINTGDGELTIVSKTEYVPGDEGQIIASLRDKNFNNINASCDAIALYPNKSIFLGQSMISNIMENYFINFSIPRVDGVYEYKVNCSWDNRQAVASSSFHVSKGRMKAWIEK